MTFTIIAVDNDKQVLTCATDSHTENQTMSFSDFNSHMKNGQLKLI